MAVTEADGVSEVAVTTSTAHYALDRQTSFAYGGLVTIYRYDLGGRVTGAGRWLCLYAPDLRRRHP
jgi:hypothetical protein